MWQRLQCVSGLPCAPSTAVCTELGGFPGAAGDGVGLFPFGEVIFIIITGFCQ